MYALINIILLGGGAALLIHGILRRRRLEAVFGGLIAVAGLGFILLLEFWAEMLWFDSLGFVERFWTVILARLGFCVAGGIIGLLTVYLLTLPIPASVRVTRRWPEAAGMFFGAVYGLSAWSAILRFIHRVQLGVTDPILSKDVGFYLFSLPLLDILQQLFFILACVALIAATAGVCLRPGTGQDILEFKIAWQQNDLPRIFRPVYLALSAALLFYGAGQFLNRYHLLYSVRGIVAGPGWTDVHVLLPAYLITAIVAAAGTVIIMVPPLRSTLRHIIGFRQNGLRARTAGAVAPVGIVALVWLTGILIIPIMFQWLYVEPNEITVERPYIEHNIDFTRAAFGLDQVKVRQFPVAPQFTRDMAEASRSVLKDIRLWDWRALEQVYEQFQEIRLYYKFADVDIDRYTVGDEYRQVMVSAREMQPQNLPEQSQTFVNLRFKYTHGYGLTMTPVSEFTPEGLPKLLIKDIPPQSTHQDVEVTRPEIYYGELTDAHVVVNTEEQEFDYPSGDQNIYTRYKGTG